MSPIIGSIAAMKAGICTGFVGYPRRYEIGSTPQESWVYGVDQAGEPFKMTVEPPQRFIDAAKSRKDRTVPVLEALASTSPRAKNPCYVHDQNAPLSVLGGCFVAEQASFIDEKNNIIKASWMSILKNFDTAADPKGKRPKICAGYMELNTKFPYDFETDQLKLKLAEINYSVSKMKEGKHDSKGGLSLIDAIEKQGETLHELMQKAQKCWFVGTDVQMSRLDFLDLKNMAHMKRTVIELISSNSFDGMYGGVIFRPIIGGETGNTVDVTSIRRLFHEYDYKAEKVPDIEGVWEKFVKDNARWLNHLTKKGYAIEAIPVQRTNGGPVANGNYTADYQSQSGSFKYLKACVSNEFHAYPYLNFANQNAYLVSPVAMRNASAASGGADNTILSTLHVFGKPFGNLLELDKDLKRTMKLSERIVPRIKSPSAGPGVNQTPG